MNILVMAGRKQAGKDSCANWLVGMTMKSLGLVNSAGVNDNGSLVVEALMEDGELHTVGIDISKQDNPWLVENVWPHVKKYSFASKLKEISVDLFDLNPLHVYGSDDDKNQPTQYKWKDFLFVLDGKTKKLLLENSKNRKEPNKNSFLSVREFLQLFGTDVMRKIYGDVWANYCLKEIERDKPELAIISDGRFPNELRAAQKRGGKIIRLTRTTIADNHKSEKSLDNFNKFDATIDNQNLNMSDQFKSLYYTLKGWDWINFEMKEV